MKELTLQIEIGKPLAEVFWRSIDPRTSPKWIDSFEEEVTSDWPARLGTVYRNRGETGEWSEYTVTAFEENKIFELTSADGIYSVTYTFEDAGDGTTRLHYREWVRNGELEAPFEMETLKKLKSFLESV